MEKLVLKVFTFLFVFVCRRQFCSERMFGEKRTRRLAREAEILLHELSPRATGLSPQE